MSVGWGFRGDYGHEAGAMVPGALVAWAVCLAQAGGIGWLTIQTHDEPLPGSHLRIEAMRARPIQP